MNTIKHNNSYILQPLFAAGVISMQAQTGTLSLGKKLRQYVMAT